MQWGADQRGDRVGAAARPTLVRSAPVAVVLTAILLVATGCTGGATADRPERPKARDGAPNIVLVLTDDQRWDSLDYMPWLRSQTNWAELTADFVEEPQCCPSRATIFTGRYSHHTGVDTLVNGKNLDETKTVATMLQSAGYRTGYIGKYLNGYPFKRKPYVPPGWDDFHAYLGATEYYDYTLFENGQKSAFGKTPDQYSTDVFTQKAVSFIQGTDPSQPLFLEVGFNSPHIRVRGFPPIPAERHRKACATRDFVPPPSFNAVDPGGEPDWLTKVKPFDPKDAQNRRQAECESVLSIDEGLAKIAETLATTGRSGNTYLVFSSDNGYSFGEHKLSGKGHLYEESVRVPLLIQGPGIAAGKNSRLTSNIDLTPTFLDWAGVAPPPDFFDGRSIMPSLRGDHSADPDAVLLRGCRTGGAGGDTAEEDSSCGGYDSGFGFAWGLRTATHKYVEYEDGSKQLFDLVADPLEMKNLASDPAAAPLQAQLKAKLDAMHAR